MKYLFGPVNSRRLGRSFGIDLLPAKICNFNCIYCEAGRTVKLTCRRREYTATREIIAEIDRYLDRVDWEQTVDVFTVTASGEPTLHSGIGRVIAHLKDLTGKRIVVLTNGTTLYRPEVRKDLSRADIVVPSLDTVVLSGLRKLNRPAAGVDLSDLVQGLVIFSGEFSGEVWLEILVARGINDRDEDILALKKVIARMRLDRIQVNTVVRPPLEDYARPVSKKRLREIAGLLSDAGGPRVEVIADVRDTGRPPAASGKNDVRTVKKNNEQIRERIAAMLQRRPCTVHDIRQTLCPDSGVELDLLLERMVGAKQIKKERYGREEFYLAP